MLRKQWLALALLPLVALVVLGARGVSRPGQHTNPCPAAQIVRGQPIDEEAFDDSLSTGQPTLRRAYLSAAAAVLDQEVVPHGAFVRIAAFGGSISGIRTICETSTRATAAAPLFAEAQTTGIKQGLRELLPDAGRVHFAAGTDIYATLVDAVEHVRSLQHEGGGRARIYVWTDGEQVAEHIHLHQLLGHGSDAAIAKRIIGNQPVPDARGVSIEMFGIGGTGSDRPASTVATRRIEDVWALVCKAMHASACAVTSDLT